MTFSLYCTFDFTDDFFFFYTIFVFLVVAFSFLIRRNLFNISYKPNLMVLNSFSFAYLVIQQTRKEGSEVAQSCLTLRNPIDCSLLGFYIHGIFQAGILEWVAISFSRRSS